MGHVAKNVRAACISFVLGLFTAGLSATGAQAVDVVPAPVIIAPGASQGDLQALQNRLSRQQFQNDQQRLRQDDRNSVIILRPPRQEVPRMRPGCQGQVYGNLPDCR